MSWRPSAHHRCAYVLLTLMVGAVADVGGTPSALAATCTQRAEAHADPNTGQSWTTVWSCGNDVGTAAYADATDSTIIGWLDTESSWFVCYRRGQQHAGGNDVWYYTQGDRSAPGYATRSAWGYVPAVHVWSSSDPWPGMSECRPDAGAATEPVRPAVDRSFYVTTIDLGQAQDLGCDQAEADASSGSGASPRSSLVVLAFGGQTDSGTGTQLTFSGRTVTTADIAGYVERFAQGYQDCAVAREGQQASVPGVSTTLAIATNNDIDSAVTAANGRAWAQLVAQVDTWVRARAGMSGRVHVTGANDLEPGFGPVAASRAWVQGFHDASTQTLVNIGSADGCPTGLSTDMTVNRTCNNGWTVEDVWWMSGGLDRTTAVPEIYYSAQAGQWALIARYGATVHGRRPDYLGILVDHATGDGSNTAQVAWSQLWNAVVGTTTAGDRQVPRYVTEICRDDMAAGGRCQWSQ